MNITEFFKKRGILDSSKINYYCARTYYALNFLTRKILGDSSISDKDAFKRI